MYFIMDVKMWRPVLDNCAEIQKYVACFEHNLIKDKRNLDAMVMRIEDKAEELNRKYSNIVRLCVERPPYDFLDFIFCRTENLLGINVFLLSWKKVRGVFQFVD